MTEMAINSAVNNHLALFILAEVSALILAVLYARKRHGRKTIL